MGIFEADLVAYPRRHARRIDAETNKINDLCKCYCECQNFSRCVDFFTRQQHGQLPQTGKDIDT